MNDQNPEAPSINNEAAFLAALGVNPGMVKAGTTNIEFQGGQPFVNFVLIVPTTWADLTKAIQAGETGQIPTTPAKPQDRKPPAKKTTRKRA